MRFYLIRPERLEDPRLRKREVSLEVAAMVVASEGQVPAKCARKVLEHAVAGDIFAADSGQSYLVVS
jgi:hypothetical protein